MKKYLYVCIAAMALLLAGCAKDGGKNESDNMGNISQARIDAVVSQLAEKHDQAPPERIKKGVSQVASFWKKEDGSAETFETFCMEHFAGDESARERLFTTLSGNYEQIWGHFNNMSLELNKALHLDVGPIEQVDIMFGGFSPAAHLTEDLFKNKIAFLTVLNFPFYSLEEKAALGPEWSRSEWAFARMGDIYTSRVPAAINQEAARLSTDADNYISAYNIVMDKLLTEEGKQIFPADLKLISHWGLRDEIKSNYADPDGLEKQRMIYQVMERIIRQDIPAVVIDNNEVTWNPYTNDVYKDDKIISAAAEPDTRYQHLLNSFHASLAADPYHPNYPTAIQRAFNQGLELSVDEVEAVFVELVSSPVLREVGALISQRLGRPLEPFDIWYDGFKTRSSIPEERLNMVVRSRYPSREAFEEGLPDILIQLGWEPDRARDIASKIVVEASRGAGHAWGAAMRSQHSHLRTRIGPSGMDYKGYNIAIHEFGHNVEQTISLHDVDYYLMSGVPNTAFTEALAFIFQSRDLQLLGMHDTDPQSARLSALDQVWDTYEIMGVSLVDMAVWKWLYEHPGANAAELKEQTILIAKEVWNQYFAPVFGVEDSPILAVYSHMISYPLYLSAYPIGKLIEFQIEAHIKDKNLAAETDRMFALGRLIPREWMIQASGTPISAQPMLDAAAEAVRNM